MKNRYLKNMATLELDESKCTNCQICIDVCPHNVFEMVNQKFTLEQKLAIVDKDACMECGACVSNCRPLALSADIGVGCAAAFISDMTRGTVIEKIAPSCDCSNGSSCC